MHPGPVVLTVCRVKAPRGKEGIGDDLIFWLLFYQEKSNSLRGD
jgi:hypothetical protein